MLSGTRSIILPTTIHLGIIPSYYTCWDLGHHSPYYAACWDQEYPYACWDQEYPYACWDQEYPYACWDQEYPYHHQMHLMTTLCLHYACIQPFPFSCSCSSQLLSPLTHLVVADFNSFDVLLILLMPFLLINALRVGIGPTQEIWQLLSVNYNYR